MDRPNHSVVIPSPSVPVPAHAVQPARERHSASSCRWFDQSETLGLVPARWALEGLSQPLDVVLPSKTGAPGVRVLVAGPAGPSTTGSARVLAGALLPGARRLSGTRFQAATREMINLVLEQVGASLAPHLVRMWSFVPGISEPTDLHAERYLTFNAGRYEAFTALLSRPEQFDRTLPTATCVGHGADALAIYAMGSAVPGLAVENPRQVPAFRYSPRYGPRPPCFARATLTRLGHEHALIIGGTASVLGEDTVHHDDLHAQLKETLANLHAVAAAATKASDGQGAWGLHSARSVRAYVLFADHARPVRAALLPALPTGCELEVVRADVCRRDLLVEVEALLTRTHPGAA